MATGQTENTRQMDRMDRRDFIKGASRFVAGGLVLNSAVVAQQLGKSKTVRDCLWLFGVPTNADNYWTEKRSVMTPAEGALYLGVPNIIMVEVFPDQRRQGFVPFQSPLIQYDLALHAFDRVLWSIARGDGLTRASDKAYKDEVLGMAIKSPNCVGLYMDDFFYGPRKQAATGRKAALTLDELRQIKQKVASSEKHLEFWATLYTGQIGPSLKEYLSLIDGVTIWTAESSDLASLSNNLKTIDNVAPDIRKMLGCYFFDYTTRQPLTIEQMKCQCELGLERLKRGSIEGIVFLDNPMEDVGYEGVEWTHGWIREVGKNIL